jgi:hypothetical protein
MRYSPKAGNRGYFSPKVKQPGRVGDHTHLHISAEVKNEWSYTYIPPIYFHGVHMGNFNLTIGAA